MPVALLNEYGNYAGAAIVSLNRKMLGRPAPWPACPASA